MPWVRRRRTLVHLPTFFAGLLLLGPLPVARAQGLVNPADQQKKSSQEAAPAGQPASPPVEPGRLRSWEYPPVEVTARRTEALREEDRIGPNAQPRWTAARRFSETRVYVVPPGQFEFEWWLVPEVPRHGSTEIKQQFEAEIGLPYRLQLDLYIVSHQQGNEGPLAFDQEKVEMRWAFADWGKIFGNPTAYLEWEANSNEPDHVETKMLFGDEIVPRWHWGLNFVYEHATGGAMDNIYEATGGVSYTVFDEKFSVGIESKLALSDVRGERGDFDRELLVGPSFQYHPLPQMHIDFAPLFGVTEDSPRFKPLVVVGWEF